MLKAVAGLPDTQSDLVLTFSPGPLADKSAGEQDSRGAGRKSLRNADFFWIFS
jgi:hypothetical protein